MLAGGVADDTEASLRAQIAADPDDPAPYLFDGASDNPLGEAALAEARARWPALVYR